MKLFWSRAAGVSGSLTEAEGNRRWPPSLQELCAVRGSGSPSEELQIRQQPSQHVQWWERNPWDPETLQLHESESSSHDDEGWKLVSPGTTWRTALSPCAGLWPQNTFSALEAHEGLGAASINTFCWLCLSMQQLQEEVAGESSWRLPTAVGGGPYLLTWAAA